MLKTGSSIGVDVGLKNVHYFRTLENRLVREQRKLCCRQLIALESESVQDEELSTAKAERFLSQGLDEIVKKHDVIGIETLQVNNMQKTAR